VVSFTDFHSDSEEDWQQIAALGMKLADSWPIMRGAVGLWLWGKHVELRGGSLSVWDSHADLRRFIRWPVHVAIMKNWRGRIRVRSASWDDERFVPPQAWLRAPRPTFGRRATCETVATAPACGYNAGDRR
jgi:hypothetical protein